MCLLGASALLLLGALLHVWFLLDDCPFDLSGDEAHYWEWSRRLDWSYYSKGPLVAWIIAAGRFALADLSERLLGNEALAVRGPAILISVITGLGLFTLARMATRSAHLALGVVAITFTIPIFAVGAVLMTIDAPLACCYTWALVACLHGLRTDRLWPWIVAGLLIAIGLLAKYNMVFIFPAVGLAILIDPAYRRHLVRPGPYLAAAVGLLGLLPIAIWNAQHDWVSFRHVAGQAGVAKGPSIDVLGPVTWFAGQAAVIGPVWFIAMLVAVGRPSPGAKHHEDSGAIGRNIREASARRSSPIPDASAMRLLLYATLVPWGVFLAFSLITKVQPNWPVLGVLPATILLGAWLRDRWQSNDAKRRRTGRVVIWSGAALGLLTVLAMHFSSALVPVLAHFAPKPSAFDLTPMTRFDPASRLRGWATLGKAVGRALAAQKAAGREPFILADDYQLASQIAFYTPGEPAVYCLQAVLGDRESQYDLWTNPIRNPEQFTGRPCIYIGARKPELFGAAGGRYQPPALRNPALIENVEYKLHGHVIQLWTIYAVESFDGLAPELLERLGKRY